MCRVRAVCVACNLQAGLSAAACCKKRGLTCVVIEKNEACGDIWRSRYHRYSDNRKSY